MPQIQTAGKAGNGILTDRQFKQLNGRHLAEQDERNGKSAELEEQLAKEQNELDNIGAFFSLTSEQYRKGHIRRYARSLSKKSFRQAAAVFQTYEKFEKRTDGTRKGTLTVPFHTFLPSESLRLAGFSTA